MMACADSLTLQRREPPLDNIDAKSPEIPNDPRQESKKRGNE